MSDLVKRLRIKAGMIEMGERIAWGSDSALMREAADALEMAAPAAHQPCPEAVREGAPYDDPAFSALCREHEIWGTPAAAQCAVFWEAGKRVAEQQPAPDVAGLVEALTMARETIASALRANAPDYFTTDADIARHVVIQRIDTAIAAHRKQQEGQP